MDQWDRRESPERDQCTMWTLDVCLQEKEKEDCNNGAVKIGYSYCEMKPDPYLTLYPQN